MSDVLHFVPLITAHDVKLGNCAKDLKSFYKAKTPASCDDDQWPPPVDNEHKIFNLAMIKVKENVRRRNVEERLIQQKTISCKVDDNLNNVDKIPIELKDVFKKVQRKKVLIEGAPGCCLLYTSDAADE